MKKSYLENVWENQLNHCWKGGMCCAGVNKFIDKTITKHTPRGKCYKRMSNLFAD